MTLFPIGNQTHEPNKKISQTNQYLFSFLNPKYSSECLINIFVYYLYLTNIIIFVRFEALTSGRPIRKHLNFRLERLAVSKVAKNIN